MTTKTRKRAVQPGQSALENGLRRRFQSQEGEAFNQEAGPQPELTANHAMPGGLRTALLGADAGAKARISSQLQRSQGNAFVQRLARVQRDPLPQEEQVIDLTGVGPQHKLLPGHGQLGSGAPGTTGTGTTTPPSAGVVHAAVNLTVNPPTIVRKKASEIAADHDRPGSAGWTTPAYTVGTPSVTGNNVAVDVTLSFIIEMDSAREHEALEVIRDHEQGHVNIGTKKAKTHLANGFKAELESLNRLTPIRYKSALNTAVDKFVAEEGSDSADYDKIDYPRMALANTGAKTPLNTLAKKIPDIAAIATALRDYNHTLIQSTTNFNTMIIEDETIIRCAQEVIAATDALDIRSTNILQYNPQFRTLVSNCRGLTNQYTNMKIYGTAGNNMLPSDENISAPVREKLAVLESALGFFTWSAPA